ncbi:3'-5' exonuclease [Actinacidiphila paucisporea]|uniref:DNA polymerase-3 subunit epsilon n=1 Tax=Actinacidiphila paucisporea TaxID=310782 RepID=A0A1M7PWR1_9ACTN|nr:3'-5' exonuclease [Actinacidiphila paucisporea]SHN22038.1 DNA polymerase-3 subunit epsilon [Actinacidiphila paucisporea]
MPSVVRTAASGYAVVDVETTGSSSKRHRVVELALVLLDRDLEPEGEFSTLVDPQGPVGPTHIHGIEPAHLGGAPRFAGIAARLLALLRGRVLVGHNVGCDRAFLAAEYARIGVRLPAVPEMCTMRMAAELRGEHPAPSGLSLVACAQALGVTGWAPHTALGDARATAALFGHFVARSRTAAGGADGIGGSGPERQLLQAAGVRWPEAPGLPVAADALWKRRSNDSSRQHVPNVRNGSA